MKNEAYAKVLGDLKTVMKRKMIDGKKKKPKLVKEDEDDEEEKKKKKLAEKKYVKEDEEEDEMEEYKKSFMKGNKGRSDKPKGLMVLLQDKKKPAPKKSSRKKGKS